MRCLVNELKEHDGFKPIGKPSMTTLMGGTVPRRKFRLKPKMVSVRQTVARICCLMTSTPSMAPVRQALERIHRLTTRFRHQWMRMRMPEREEHDDMEELLQDSKT